MTKNTAICPLCLREIPLSEITVHMATCVGLPPSPEKIIITFETKRLADEFMIWMSEVGEQFLSDHCGERGVSGVDHFEYYNYPGDGTDHYYGDYRLINVKAHKE